MGFPGFSYIREIRFFAALLFIHEKETRLRGGFFWFLLDCYQAGRIFCNNFFTPITYVCTYLSPMCKLSWSLEEITSSCALDIMRCDNFGAFGRGNPLHISVKKESYNIS